MSSCSGNSTDCLLGELVDQGRRGFNWDPLNFAFTAVLSVLGFSVASLALLQGLLAAGPGRLKASQNVLGPVYGKTARTHFDWTEWRFRTAVQVPIIDVAQIISATSPSLERNDHSGKKEKPPKQEHTRPSRNPMKRHLLRAFRSTGHAPDVEAPIAAGGEVSASWTMLLRHVGLEAVKLRMKYCKTDHLPADVTAAPAFATVESLIILAVLAGCTSYYVGQDVNLAKGPQVQMVFRQHPSLGLVATYQSYKERQDSDFLLLQHTRWACREALGYIRYLQKPFVEIRCLPRGQIDVRTNLTYLYNVLHAQGNCNHDSCASQVRLIGLRPRFGMEDDSYIQSILLVLLFADRPQAAMLFPLRLFRHFWYVHLLIKGSESWSVDPLNVTEALKVLPARGNSLLLFRCHASRRLVTIDPQHSKVEAHHLSLDDSDVASQPLIGDNLAGNTQQTWFGPEVFPGQGAPLKAFPLHPHNFTGVPPEEAPKLLSAMDGDLMVSADALDLCFHWRNDARFIQDLTVPEKTEARKWLAWQLATIDCWLRDHGGQDALCAALNLLAQHFATAKDMLKVRDGHPYPRLAILDGGLSQETTSPANEAPEMGEGTDDEHNQQLMIYTGSRNHTLRRHTRSDFGDIPASGPGDTDARTSSQLLLEWSTDEEAQSAAEQETAPGRSRHHQTRKPWEDEYSVMSYFARHMRRCRRCPNLWEMHLQEGATLCERGWIYARDFARYIYPHNGRPYSVVDKQEGHDIELELDEVNSESVLALLFAMEHGLWMELFREFPGRVSTPPEHTGGTSREAPPADGAGATRQRSRERVRPTWRPKDRVKAMEAMLLFRAVLYASLTSTAMDSSDILEMRDRDEIVQVL